MESIVADLVAFSHMEHRVPRSFQRFTMDLVVCRTPMLGFRIVSFEDSCAVNSRRTNCAMRE
jgi:hypothetical protein